MAPRRRSRSSSASSSSPERRKYRPKRSYSCRMRHASYRSRRRERSPSSDFEDYRYRHKYSPVKNHYRARRHDFCYKRRTRSSDSYESDDYRYDRRRRSNNRHYSPRRSSPRRSSCPRRKRISSSPDYPHSRDLYCHQKPALVMPKRKPDMIDSDIEILEDKRSKKKCFRSTSKECVKTQHLYAKSGKFLQEKNFDKALKCVNLALKLHENGDKKLLSKIYSRRGTIYSLQEKPRCPLQAFIDWEHAYLLDNDNVESRKSMSKVLFMGANKLYRKKAYGEALVPVMRAIDLDKANGEASILLKLIQKKLVEVIKRKDMAMKKTVSKSSTKTGTEKDDELVKYSKRAIFSEIERLNQLTALAVKEENFPRAIIYVNKALQFHKEMPEEKIFDKLFILKQDIMNSVTFFPELTSD